MRKFILGMALATFGLGSPAVADESPFVGGEDETYFMVSFLSGVAYWAPVYEMMEQAGEQLGVKTVFTGSVGYDLNQQLAVFEQVLAQNPAGILVAPMNPGPFIEPINRATAMGVPVVTFGTDSPDSNRISYVAPDDRRLASEAADLIAEAMGGTGEYAVTENPGQEGHDLRVRSFIERMESNWPDMKLAGRIATNQDPTKAYTGISTLAQAHPNLGAVFSPEASSAIGAAQAGKELGGNILVVCADVNEQVLKMIKEGEVFAAFNPNQGVQGYMSMMLAYLAKHQLIDPMNDYSQSGVNPVQIPNLDNGFSIVTADNTEFFSYEPYKERRDAAK